MGQAALSSGATAGNPLHLRSGRIAVDSATARVKSQPASLPTSFAADSAAGAAPANADALESTSRAAHRLMAALGTGAAPGAAGQTTWESTRAHPVPFAHAVLSNASDPTFLSGLMVGDVESLPRRRLAHYVPESAERSRRRARMVRQNIAAGVAAGGLNAGSSGGGGGGGGGGGTAAVADEPDGFVGGGGGGACGGSELSDALQELVAARPAPAYFALVHEQRLAALERLGQFFRDAYLAAAISATSATSATPATPLSLLAASSMTSGAALWRRYVPMQTALPTKQRRAEWLGLRAMLLLANAAHIDDAERYPVRKDGAACVGAWIRRHSRGLCPSRNEVSQCDIVICALSSSSSH